ncbi:MAG: hypothetical protein AB8B65_17875 [Kordia sp.]
MNKFLVVVVCVFSFLGLNTAKDEVSVSTTKVVATQAAYGFFSMYIYDNSSLRRVSKLSNAFEENYEISIKDNSVYYEQKKVLDPTKFDSKFSYLIDAFKDENGTYIIASEVNTDHVQVISDTNILARNKLFIYDVKTQKKYIYVYPSAEKGLILPTTYYNNLPGAVTLKSIDIAAKTITIEKKNPKITAIKVTMVAVEEF